MCAFDWYQNDRPWMTFLQRAICTLLQKRYVS